MSARVHLTPVIRPAEGARGLGVLRKLGEIHELTARPAAWWLLQQHKSIIQR
jgi:hypothetical protein